MKPLTIVTSGDQTLIVTRAFDVDPERVYLAHITPALLQKWCLGPDGWTMPVCQCDPRPGGAIRYEWRKGAAGFHLTGQFLALEPFHRIVHVERMHLPGATPDNHVETTFALTATGGTQMVMRMTLPDASLRDAMIASDMAGGMELSYQRLEGLVTAINSFDNSKKDYAKSVD